MGVEIIVWVRPTGCVSQYSVSSKHDFNSSLPSWTVPKDHSDSVALNFTGWMDWSTAVNISCKIKAENSSSKLHGAREDIYFDFWLLFPVSHKSILTLSCTIFWLVYNHINTSWERNQQWQDITTWRKAVLQGVGKFITRRSEKKRYTPIAQDLKREISYGLNLERFQLSRLRKASDIMFFRHHIRNGRVCVCVKYYRIASIESYTQKVSFRV